MAIKHSVDLSIESVTDEKLVEWYNRAAIVVVASYLEPFGFTPLEAMACETPVVGIREGGFRESVIHNETGFLVDRNTEACAAALEQLLTNEPLRKRLGQTGRRCVEDQWTWARCVDRLEQIFEQIKNG